MQVVDKKQLIIYYATGSYFLLFDGNNETYCIRNCREETAFYFTSATKIIGYKYVVTGISARQVLSMELFVEFWRELESRLGLKPAQIHATQYEGLIVVEVDPWWSMNETRRQFFTLFMRCGAVFYKGEKDRSGFEKAIEAYDLSRIITPAVYHFLRGNTTPTYEGISGKGIVDTFKNITDTKLNEKLIRLYPNPDPSCVCESSK